MRAVRAGRKFVRSPLAVSLLSVLPPAVLNHTEQVGFNDILVDPDGIVRRGLLFLDDGETSFFAFALRLALLSLQDEGITLQPAASNPQHLRLGQVTLRPFEPHDGGYVNADARGYQFLLDWRGMPRAFPAFSLETLLAGEVPAHALRDKVVLIGVTAISMKDVFYTPYSRGLHAEQQLPGVVMHAHMVSQLLQYGLDGALPIVTMSDRQQVLWLLLWGMLGGAVGLWVRSLWRFTPVAAGGLLALSLTTYVAFAWKWWMPVMPPALAWLTTAALVIAYMSCQEQAQRALLKELFARHVSPEVAETLWRQRGQFLSCGRLRPQRMIVSVLCTELLGVSSVSEKTAAMLERLDKNLLPPDPMRNPCRILIGETTLRYLGTQFRTQRVGEIPVEGKEERIPIYHISGRVHDSARDGMA
jgi:adenylate cyclase